METKADDLRGMNAADAREYIFRYITTLKLTEKSRSEVKAELDKWKGRVELAQNKGAADLAEAAQKEAEALEAKLAVLEAEEAELRAQIETMYRQLPGLAARERSIDPDLLEQELKIVLGETPGEENDSKTTRRRIDELSADMSADAALAALKTKMGLMGNAAGAVPDSGPDNKEQS
jgi:phage shock protein A